MKNLLHEIIVQWSLIEKKFNGYNKDSYSIEALNIKLYFVPDNSNQLILSL